MFRLFTGIRAPGVVDRYVQRILNWPITNNAGVSAERCGLTCPPRRFTLLRPDQGKASMRQSERYTEDFRPIRTQHQGSRPIRFPYRGFYATVADPWELSVLRSGAATVNSISLFEWELRVRVRRNITIMRKQKCLRICCWVLEAVRLVSFLSLVSENVWG